VIVVDVIDGRTSKSVSKIGIGKRIGTGIGTKIETKTKIEIKIKTKRRIIKNAINGSVQINRWRMFRFQNQKISGVKKKDNVS
jgi:hypothetical protein